MDGIEIVGRGVEECGEVRPQRELPSRSDGRTNGARAARKQRRCVDRALRADGDDEML